MKKLMFSILVTLTVFSSCKNQTQKIEITPDITFSTPNIKFSVNDSINNLKTWDAKFQDNRITIFKYSINQKDTLNNSTLKQAFKKNIHAFLKTFDLTNIDSTFIYKNECFQSNLEFDYKRDEKNYSFYGRFLAYKQYFIAFCFHTPLPLNNHSKSIKDQMFDSIKIR